jgi:hypothetical protein
MTVVYTDEASSPDERSDIRDYSNIAPDIAALIRATLASWRPININRPAIRVGGSPFKTFAEAEKACEAMLVHLTT